MTGIHRTLALVAAALGCAAWLVDGWPGGVEAATTSAPRFIAAPDLAARIIGRDPALRLFDLRSHAEFERFHVPGAAHATVRGLTRRPLPAGTTVVLYGNTVTHATRAWTRLDDRRRREVLVLRGGLFEWIARVHEPRLAVDATEAERAEFVRALPLSRFFGGQARENVPRAEVPTGYWTGTVESDHRTVQATLLAVAAIRRRGC
jgi:rhodanese-related sulfurtransferase